jgi:hypothetical protein
VLAGRSGGVENLNYAESFSFEWSVLRRNAERLSRREADRLMIAHGSLGASYRSVLAFLKAHSDLTENWPVKRGVDCSHDDTIPALMLNYAAQANENELVLFSSKSALRVNHVKAVLEPDICVLRK